MADQINLGQSEQFDLGEVATFDIGEGAGIDLSAPYEPERLDPNSAGVSLSRGIDTMQGNIYKAIESFAEEVGQDDAAEWARKKATDNYQQAFKHGAPIAMKDVDTLEEVADFVISRGAELLPTVLGYAGSAAAGTVLGGPVGTMAAVATFGGAQNVGDVARVLEERGVDELDAGAWLLAGGMTALDAWGLNKITSPLLKQTAINTVKKEGADATRDQLKKAFIKNGVRKEVAHNAAVAATAEAVASAATVGALEVGTAAIADDEVSEDFMWMLGEAALLGGAAGTAFGSAGGYVKAKNLADIIDGKSVRSAMDTHTHVVTESSNPVIKAGQRTWKLLSGKPLDPILPEITTVQAGRDVRTVMEVDLPNRVRELTGENLSTVETVKQTAKAHYDKTPMPEVEADAPAPKKDWMSRLQDDLTKGVENEATQAYRSMMDNDFMQSKELGMVSDRQYVKDYSAVQMDKDAILNNKVEFEEELRSHNIDIDSDAGKTKLTNYYNALESDNWRVYDNPVARLTPEEIAAGKDKEGAYYSSDTLQSQHGNIEGHRIWNAPQSFYQKWSKNKTDGKAWWDGQVDYMVRAAHRKAGVEFLGKKGEKLNKKLLEMQSQMLNKTDEAGAPVPETLSNAAVDRIYDTVSAFNNTLGRIESKAYRNVAQGVSTLANITALPFAVLGSLTEPFNIAMKTDMGTFIRMQQSLLAGIGHNLASVAARRGPTDRHKTNAAEMSKIGQTLSAADLAVEARMTEPGLTKWAANINRVFFRLNGLTYWTQATKPMGAEATRLVLHDDVKTITEMPNTAQADRARARLAELGVGPFRYDLFRDGQNLTSKQKAMKIEVEAQAINRFLKEIVLEPNWSNRPHWQSNQQMWMFSKLLGYPTVFSNTVLPNLHAKFKGGVPHSVVDGLFIYGMMAMVGGMQMGVRDILSGREPFERQEDLGDVMMEATARYSVPVPVTMAMQLVRGENYGRTPADTMFGVVGSLSSDALTFMKDMMTGEMSPGEGAMEFLKTFTPAKALKNWDK